jgi:hypothetical protein
MELRENCHLLDLGFSDPLFQWLKGRGKNLQQEIEIVR